MDIWFPDSILSCTCLILVVRFDHVMKFSNRWGNLLPCLLNSRALHSSQHILMYTLSHKMMVAGVLLLMERQTSQRHQTDGRIQNWKTLYKTLFNKHLAALHFQLSKVLGTSACHPKQLSHYGRMKSNHQCYHSNKIHTLFLLEMHGVIY